MYSEPAYIICGRINWTGLIAVYNVAWGGRGLQQCGRLNVLIVNLDLRREDGPNRVSVWYVSLNVCNIRKSNMDECLQELINHSYTEEHAIEILRALDEPEKVTRIIFEEL